MKSLKRAWLWLVLSSADPKKVSMTLKALSVNAITVLTVMAGLAQIELPSEQLTALVDGLIASIQMVLLLISSLVAVVSLFRKIWSTMSGTNEVVNFHPGFSEKEE